MQHSNIVIDRKESTISKRSTKSSLFSWVRFILLLIAIYCVLHFGIAIKIVSGHSMNPTLHDKGIMVVNKLFYKPDRGDIVIVRDPDGFDIVKRIIGLPNDKILIKNGMVYVNGSPLKETYTKGSANDMNEVVLNNQSYFIIGDNRTHGESLDSRDPSIGPIDKSNIEGKVIIH